MAPFTKPVKSGVGLPGTCNQGEVYFRYDVTPGNNLNLCTATNTWSQISTSSGGTGSNSPLTAKGDLWGFSTSNIRIPAGMDGQVLKADSTRTSGLRWTNDLGLANIDGTQVITATTLGVNTATMASRATVVNGSDTTCLVLSGSSSVYAGATLGNPITAHASGMRILAKLDVTTSGGPITLDCGAGAKPVFQNDGASNPTNTQWSAGNQVLLAYDSTLNTSQGAWRILSGVAAASSGGSTKTNPNELWYPTAVNMGGCETINWTIPSSYVHGIPGSTVCVTRIGNSDKLELTLEIPQNWTGTLSISALLSLYVGDSGEGYFATNYKVACFTAPSNIFSGAASLNTPTQISHTFTGTQAYTGVVDTVTPNLAGCSASTATIKNYMIIHIDRDPSSTSPDGTDMAGAFISLPYTL